MNRQHLRNSYFLASWHKLVTGICFDLVKFTNSISPTARLSSTFEHVGSSRSYSRHDYCFCTKPEDVLWNMKPSAILLIYIQWMDGLFRTWMQARRHTVNVPSTTATAYSSHGGMLILSPSSLSIVPSTKLTPNFCFSPRSSFNRKGIPLSSQLWAWFRELSKSIVALEFPWSAWAGGSLVLTLDSVNCHPEKRKARSS